jgi:hypothetical protein
MVRETAREMAGAIFEEVMKDNERWKLWQELCPELTPSGGQKAYMDLAWPHLVEQARATLAQMLTGGLNDDLKELIANALILDNQLRLKHEAKAPLLQLNH